MAVSAAKIRGLLLNCIVVCSEACRRLDPGFLKNVVILVVLSLLGAYRTRRSDQIRWRSSGDCLCRMQPKRDRIKGKGCTFYIHCSSSLRFPRPEKLDLQVLRAAAGTWSPCPRSSAREDPQPQIHRRRRI